MNNGTKITTAMMLMTIYHPAAVIAKVIALSLSVSVGGRPTTIGPVRVDGAGEGENCGVWDGDGDNVGVGVSDGLGVGVTSGVGVGVEVGVDDGVGLVVGDGDGVGDSLGVGSQDTLKTLCFAPIPTGFAQKSL